MGRGRKIAEAFVEIGGDKGAFSKTIKGAKRETAGFAKSATKNLKKIAIGLTVIGVAAAVAATAIAVKLTKAIIRAGTAVVKTAVKYDKLKIGLIAITGSAEEATRQLRRLRVLALDPGLGFEQAIRGSISLQAAALSAQFAERSLSAFGNALVIAGKGAESLDRVNLQLTQIAAKTSGFGEDIRNLRDAVPQIGPILAKAFNNEPLEKIKISGKELVEVLVTGLEELDKAGESVGNNLVNLGVSFDLLKNEIGKTMLGVTSDTTKSLTAVIDKIAMIIPVWKQYQDQVAIVFKNVGIIAIRTTGAMLATLAGMVKDIAVIMWEPLADGLKLVFAKLATETHIPITFKSDIPAINKLVSKLNKPINDAFKKLGEDLAGGEGIAALEAKLEKSTEKAFSGLTGIALKTFAELSTELTAGLQEMNIELDKFTITLPEIETTTTKAAIAELRKIAPGALDFLTLKAEDPRKAVQRQTEAAQRIFDFRSALDAEMSDRQQRFTDNFRDGLRRQEEAAQRMVDTIRPAFENMFTSLFSGNTKNLWQKFWVDLKNIAIRQMAAIFATQLITGLLTGGTSLAATGGASFLNSLAPRSIDPTSRAIGGAAVRGASAVGTFLEGGTVIIQDQDLGNFDAQRLTKQVEQGIAPALAEASADGIQQ